MHIELTKYQKQLDILVDFIEGRLDGSTLDVALATDEMKTLLSYFEEARYPALTNHYRRLQRQDRITLGGLVNSEGIIEEFLKQAGVPCRPSERYGNAFSLILGAVPSYVDPPLEFLTEKIIPLDSTLSKTQKKKLIRDRCKQLFQYVDKPPKWIQNPDWPIHDGKPLIFVGQLAVDAPDLFHDKGMVYLFYAPSVGSFETVAQFY